MGVYAIFKPEVHLAFGDIKITCYFLINTEAPIFKGREQRSKEKPEN